MTTTDYQLLANLVLAFHVLMVVYLIASVAASTTGLLSRHPLLRRIDLTILLITISSQVIFLGCPLTLIEQALRRRADPDWVFGGSFMVLILQKLTGMQVSEIPRVVTVLGFILMAVVSVGSYFIWKPSKKDTKGY